jgi:hypothetical protein
MAFCEGGELSSADNRARGALRNSESKGQFLHKFFQPIYELRNTSHLGGDKKQPDRRQDILSRTYVILIPE